MENQQDFVLLRDGQLLVNLRQCHAINLQPPADKSADKQAVGLLHVYDAAKPIDQQHWDIYYGQDALLIREKVNYFTGQMPQSTVQEARSAGSGGQSNR